jgi:hypothetical protein
MPDNQTESADTQSGDVPLDTVIRVDRAVGVKYPDYMKEVMYPDLEKVGPAGYCLTLVKLFTHSEQQDRQGVSGDIILRYLTETGMLEKCLGLVDALEIQKKGLVVYRKFFGSKSVFFWKSVILDREGIKRVPYLFDTDADVVVRWKIVGTPWRNCLPAAYVES